MNSSIEKPVFAEDTVYLIDASIYIFKYYFSMPSNWHSKSGRPTETIYGFVLWLLRFLEQTQTKTLVCCFDESLGSCFRNDIYSDYKCSRVLPDEDLAYQLLACKKMCECLGIPSYASATYEADDLLACFASMLQKKGKPYAVVSRDKDLGQLVTREGSSFWDFPDTLLAYDDIVNKMGVRPEQIPDYLALLGDTSDDIPGVPGLGKKTAVALLSHYDSWADMKENLETVAALPIRGAKKLREKLEEYSTQIELALQLSTVHRKGLSTRLSDVKKKAADIDRIRVLSDEFGFPAGFMKRIENMPVL